MLLLVRLRKIFEVTAAAKNADPNIRFYVTYHGVQDRCDKLITTYHHEDALDCKRSGTAGKLYDADEMLTTIAEAIDYMHESGRQNKEKETNT